MSNYVQKYYEEIFLSELENAYYAGLISQSDKFITYVKSRQDISNFYVMNLSVLADSFEDVYYDMTDVYLSDKVAHATGDDLDDIGDRVGCKRPLDSYAQCPITFSFSLPSSVSVPLPAGVIVSDGASIVYQTIEDVTVPAGADRITIQAQATDLGPSKRVLANSLTKIETDWLSSGNSNLGLGNITCTNLTSSSGGSYYYDDPEYRDLILEWRKENIRGTEEAYNKYFANLDGLDSYKLIPNWDGSGTLKIVLDPGTSFQLNQVYDDIRSGVCQMPEDITLFAPEPINLTVYAKCNVDIDLLNPYSDVEKESIQSRIEDAVYNYIEGNTMEFTGLGIGEDFIPYQLGVFIHEQVPELKNITFTSNDSKADPNAPISITDEQQARINPENIKIIME